MPKSKLRNNTGDIDSTQIAIGMNAALRNARRLADDAKLLLKAERYPTAVSLAVLSIEESGKTRILRQLAGAPGKEDRRKIWKEYRLHRSKNVAWILPRLVRLGARNLESLQLATDTSSQHTNHLERVKQSSIYTDWLGNSGWSEPDEVISDQMAQSLVRIADLLAKKPTITVKEIELWKEHIGPVYGASLKVQKTALLNWFAAMRENGLWSEGNISIEEFVRGE